MKGFRRFVGFALYMFMAFPLMLGGLSLAAMRPLADKPEAVRAMVTDERFVNLLESPDLAAMAEGTMRFGEAELDLKAAVQAFQAAVPADVVVETASGAIDAAFDAVKRKEAFFYVDARPLKTALAAGAPVFASTYISAASGKPVVTNDAGSGTALLVVPDGAAGNAVVKAVVLDAVKTQPDEWLVGETGSRLELPARIGTMGASLTGASVWLLLTGAGICFASVMVADSDWRRRLGRMGSRLLAPSIIVLLVGLVPHLVVPGGLVRLSPEVSVASMPALAEYLRFVATRIGSGFLTAGLVGLGIGTAFVSAKRALPPSDDEALD